LDSNPPEAYWQRAQREEREKKARAEGLLRRADASGRTKLTLLPEDFEPRTLEEFFTLKQVVFIEGESFDEQVPSADSVPKVA
jgi:hypothetical protein